MLNYLFLALKHADNCSSVRFCCFGCSSYLTIYAVSAVAVAQLAVAHQVAYWRLRPRRLDLILLSWGSSWTRVGGSVVLLQLHLKVEN